jgi:hypothetical protein
VAVCGCKVALLEGDVWGCGSHRAAVAWEVCRSFVVAVDTVLTQAISAVVDLFASGCHCNDLAG